MAQACKCDICGKLYEAPMSVPDLKLYRYQHLYGEKRLDLCDECQEKLELFVNENQEVTNAQKVKHGKYIGEQQYGDCVMQHCSQCGYLVYVDDYCGHCGAMMDLEDRS